jgi:hypothetical protein
MEESQEFECAVGKALLIVRERREILSKTAHDFIQLKLKNLRIDEFVQAVERLNTAPFDSKKVFLADLAIVVTRVWEAYSFDIDGNYYMMKLLLLLLKLTNGSNRTSKISALVRNIQGERCCKNDRW